MGDYLKDIANLDQPDVYGRTAREVLTNRKVTSGISSGWGDCTGENKESASKDHSNPCYGSASFWSSRQALPALREGDIKSDAPACTLPAVKSDYNLKEIKEAALTIAKKRGNLSADQRKIIKTLVEMTSRLEHYIQQQQRIDALQEERERNAVPIS